MWGLCRAATVPQVLLAELQLSGGLLCRELPKRLQRYELLRSVTCPNRSSAAVRACAVQYETQLCERTSEHVDLSVASRL